MVSEREFCEDQRRDALSVARGGSRRRSVGKHRHQTPRSPSSIEIPQENNEVLGNPYVIATVCLKSSGVAMKVIDNVRRQMTGRRLNNRAENSYLPFRRRERAILRFRQSRCVQKFVSIHTSVHNHFYHERHLNSQTTFKLKRTAALAEWRQLCAA